MPHPPDHDFFVQARDRLGGNRACLTVARKLLKRAHHTLRELGDEAIARTAELRARLGIRAGHRYQRRKTRARPVSGAPPRT